MFRTPVPSALYNLSDDRIEYQVRDRLSFMRFPGLGLEDRVPDAKTVRLYREGLAQAGPVESLFSRFDGFLSRQGYIARGGQILDASIVPVPRNHNTRDENRTIRNGKVPQDWSGTPAKRSRKDTDARWTGKHGKSHYGYRNHVNVDRRHKPVRRCHVTDAALHDSRAVDSLPMRGNTGSGVRADAACRPEEMEARAAGSETEEPHPPQGQARQAADRAGEGQQPDQIQSKGPGGTRLWRADQRHGRDDGTHDRHRTRQSRDRDEEHRLQHAPPRCVAPHKSLPGVNTRQTGKPNRTPG